ncbi:DnaB-like helicase C-terminal domain-containing protein [Lignipirellula cremea]|nr:DnaB-like helicase C-terminal domain-containing protein [Lignipirellula cremea]
MAKAKVRQTLEDVQHRLEPRAELSTLYRTLKSSIDNDPLYGSNRNPVIQVILDRLVEGVTSDQVQQQAIYQLENRLEDYQAILNDLVPPDLISWVVQKQAAQAFNEGQNDSLDDDWDEYVRRLQSPAYVGFFPTGIASLDDALGGGVHGLTCICGDKGVGKTWLLVNTCLATLLADASASVLFYSLDAPKKRIMDRIAGCYLDISFRELQPDNVTNETLLQVRSIPQSLRRRVRIVERDFAFVQDTDSDTHQQRGMTSASVKQDITRLMRTSGTARTLVVVDLFQKMLVPGYVSASEHDQYRLDVIDEVSQQFRKSHGDGSISFFVASEMRKRSEGARSTVPSIDDMKGDGRLASDADNILLLGGIQEVDANVNDVVCHIGKGRDGVIRGKYRLRFNHRLGSFGPREDDPSPKPKNIEMPSSSIDPLAE